MCPHGFHPMIFASLISASSEAFREWHSYKVTITLSGAVISRVQSSILYKCLTIDTWLIDSRNMSTYLRSSSAANWAGRSARVRFFCGESGVLRKSVNTCLPNDHDLQWWRWSHHRNQKPLYNCKQRNDDTFHGDRLRWMLTSDKRFADYWIARGGTEENITDHNSKGNHI